MSEKECDKTRVFDNMFANDQIQKLKIIYFYLDSGFRRGLALYIKFAEFMHVLTTETPSFSQSCASKDNADTIATLCDEVLPYCSFEECEKMKQMNQMFKNMENIQQLMNMLNAMKDAMPDMKENMGNAANDEVFDFNQLFQLFL